MPSVRTRWQIRQGLMLHVVRVRMTTCAHHAPVQCCVCGVSLRGLGVRDDRLDVVFLFEEFGAFRLERALRRRGRNLRRADVQPSLVMISVLRFPLRKGVGSGWKGGGSNWCVK
jgi:hypothetical protein